MKVSILTTIHDKPADTVTRVLDGLRDQQADQLVLTLDRVNQATTEAAQAFPGATLATLTGPPGWRSPCIAANAGLALVTGDITLYSQGDVVHAPGNLKIVRAHFAAHPASVLFGRVTESDPTSLTGIGHAGPVLQGTDNPRFMTYLLAAPTTALKAINGWDEAFQAGVWYEDDDLIARLWKHGLSFTINDALSGIHQSHPRPYSLPIRIAPNMALMLHKHGRQSSREIVLQTRPSLSFSPGLATWSHTPTPQGRAA